MKLWSIFFLTKIAVVMTSILLGCTETERIQEEDEFDLVGEWEVHSMRMDGEELIDSTATIVPLTFSFHENEDAVIEGSVKNHIEQVEDNFIVTSKEEGEARLEFTDLSGEYVLISYENGQMLITSPEEFPDSDDTYMKASKKE